MAVTAGDGEIVSHREDITVKHTDRPVMEDRETYGPPGVLTALRCPGYGDANGCRLPRAILELLRCSLCCFFYHGRSPIRI